MTRTFYIYAFKEEPKGIMLGSFVMEPDDPTKIKRFSSHDAAERWLNISAIPDPDVVFEIRRGYVKEVQNGKG